MTDKIKLVKKVENSFSDMEVEKQVLFQLGAKAYEFGTKRGSRVLGDESPLKSSSPIGKQNEKSILKSGSIRVSNDSKNQNESGKPPSDLKILSSGKREQIPGRASVPVTSKVLYFDKKKI